jgi:DHA1 family tetracycline resistance protein-like MFS transporter
MKLTGEGLSRAAIYGGWLGFAYAVMQFLSASVLGGLSDSIGRRPVILFSLCALGIDYIVMGLAPTLPWLFLGRALAGIAGASFIPAYAYLADVSPPEKRAQNFGLVGAAFGIGFIIGPALGGLLGGFGTRVPFFAAAGLALANTTFGFFVLPESLPKDRRRPFELRRANPIGSLLQIRKYPVVPGLAAAIFLWQVAHQVFPSTWSFYTMYRFNWTATMVGASLAVIGAIMAISQGVLSRRVVPAIGERRTALVGLTCAMFAHLGFAFATRGWMMFALLSAWLLVGLVYPSMNAIMSRIVPPDAQGELQGAVASLFSIALIVSPPIMTQLFGRFSAPNAPIRFPGAAFACASLLVSASALMLVRATRSMGVEQPKVNAA